MTMTILVGTKPSETLPVLRITNWSYNLGAYPVLGSHRSRLPIRTPVVTFYFICSNLTRTLQCPHHQPAFNNYKDTSREEAPQP